MKRDRPVAVTVNPAEPLPEIHVAPDAPTVLLFPADIQKKTITVDQSRIRVVDTGARSIIVQAVGDYRPDERQELEVFFADGKAPARAAFVLVMDPAEVDTRIDVQRPEPPNAACPAETQRAEPRPEDFVLMGFVDERGVPTAKVRSVGSSARPVAESALMASQAHTSIPTLNVCRCWQRDARSWSSRAGANVLLTQSRWTKTNGVGRFDPSNPAFFLYYYVSPTGFEPVLPA